MRVLRVVAPIAVGGLLVSALALSQQPSAQQPGLTPFTITGREVIVPVTVTDDKGKFVSNLVQSDFRVLDEGRPQKINFFSHTEKQPIVVGFLIDQSNATKIHWDKYKE